MADISQATEAQKPLTIEQQNDLSAKTIAANLLSDVSQGFNVDKVALEGQVNMREQIFTNIADGSGPIQNYFEGIKGDPLRQQIANQLGTDMADPAMMQKLGLTGSVQRDSQNNVTELVFGNSDTAQLYNNDIVSREKNGATPTQAVKEFDYDHLNMESFHGTFTVNLK